MKKIFVFLSFFSFLLPSFAFFSVPITEGIVNGKIASSFPNEIKKVEFTRYMRNAPST